MGPEDWGGVLYRLAKFQIHILKKYGGETTLALEDTPPDEEFNRFVECFKNDVETINSKRKEM